MFSISKPPVPLPKIVFHNVHIGLQHWAPDRHTDTQTHTQTHRHTAVDMEVPPELKKCVHIITA